MMRMGRALMKSNTAGINDETGAVEIPTPETDCPFESGDYRCVLGSPHTGKHKLVPKFTLGRSQEEEHQCPHVWENLRCTKEDGHVGPCDMDVDHNYYHKENTSMVPTTAPTNKTSDDAFPFTLNDLDYWIIKRKDGIISKYVVLPEAKHPMKIGEVRKVPAYPAPSHTAPIYSLGDLCAHNGNIVLWKDDDRSLHVCNARGLRDHYKDFDLVIDCGQILNLTGIRESRLLRGDDYLVDELECFGYDYVPAILKIDWDDREAPLLDPAFWPALAKLCQGKVATACQGGHGRSGTALVCLLMSLIQDYSPYDAICHLRALHCGRAIESKTQHEYIAEVGKHLKREENIELVSGVKDFRAAFLEITKESAKPWQEQLTKK